MSKAQSFLKSLLEEECDGDNDVGSTFLKCDSGQILDKPFVDCWVERNETSVDYGTIDDLLIATLESLYG
jgi:hypothetical protein